METLSKRGEYAFEGYAGYLTVLPNDNMIHRGGNFSTNLTCITPEGTELWLREDCCDTALQKDGTLVGLFGKDGEYYVQRLDPETGEGLGERYSLIRPESGTNPTQLLVDTIQPGTPVPIRYYTFGTSEVYTLDWETGEMRRLEAETEYPDCARIDSDGRMYFLGQELGMGISGFFEDNRVLTPGTWPVYCYDLYTGEKLWENEVSACVPGDLNLEFLPGGRLLCQLGNVFQVMDTETGETLNRCEAGSSVMTLAVGEKNATALLEDGYVCYYWFDANYTYEVKFAQNGVSMGQIGENLYLHYSNCDYVTVFRTEMPDPEWILPVEQELSIELQTVSGHYLACRDYYYVYLFDLQSRELVWMDERSRGGLLDFSEDGSRLYYIKDSHVLVELDIAAGKAEGYVLPDEEGLLHSEGFLLRDNLLYYVIEAAEGEKVVRLDLQTGESLVRDIPTPEQVQETWRGWYALEAKEDYIWLWAHEQLLIEMNVDTGAYRILTEETTQRPAVAADSEGEHVAVADNGGISLRKIGGEEERFLPLDGAAAGSLHFRNGELLALCTNGVVYRFDADGAVLSRTALTVGYDFAGRLVEANTNPREILWQFTPDGKLVLNLRGEGSVIDCETWGVTASVSYFLAWDESSDTLVCDLADSLAGFPMYETGQLLELARQELGSFTLTGEQKAAYGID